MANILRLQVYRKPYIRKNLPRERTAQTPTKTTYNYLIINKIKRAKATTLSLNFHVTSLGLKPKTFRTGI